MENDNSTKGTPMEGVTKTTTAKTRVQGATGDIQRDNGLSYIQDDYEFEDFKADDWDDEQDDITLKKTVWADTWEDDDDEEDFYDQLKKQKEMRSDNMNTD